MGVMTNKALSISDARIRALRSEATEAGDYVMAGICTIALEEGVSPTERSPESVRMARYACGDALDAADANQSRDDLLREHEAYVHGGGRCDCDDTTGQKEPER